MIVNRENIKTIFIGLKTEFKKAFEKPTKAPKWPQVATLVTSTTSENSYSWLGAFPRFREWIGTKVVQSLEAFNYAIKNRSFEATVEVKRDDIEDDNVVGYGVQAADIGDSAAIWPDDLVAHLLNQGTVEKCYDGKAFFATTHPGVDQDEKRATYSNSGAEVLSNATQKAAMAGFGAARDKMAAYRDDKGKLLKIEPTVLIVPPALRDVATLLMTSDKLGDGSPNPYKGACDVQVWPELEDSQAWFLLDCSRRVKPLIFQQRKAPVFVQQTGMDSNAVFDTGKFRFGGEARGNAGYGLWQQAYRASGQDAG